MKVRQWGVLLGLGAAICLAAPTAAAAQDATQITRGEELFKTLPNKCPVCHKIGPKSSGGKIGPDLEGVAKRHPESWFVPYLTNPKSVKPSNVMPAVKVNDADMKALVAFLMSLKGGAHP